MSATEDATTIEISAIELTETIGQLSVTKRVEFSEPVEVEVTGDLWRLFDSDFDEDAS